MYYSVIGLLAATILLIENHDILLNVNGAFERPFWKVYRRFLFTVFFYYVTDVLWGILENRKLAEPLFIDTTIYFIAMAGGVLFWTQYTVIYLDEHNSFGRFLIYAGRIFAALVTSLSAVNIFYPVLFTVDQNCIYTALETRYVVLFSQIVLLLVLSAYAFSSFMHRSSEAAQKNRYLGLALFGVIMATFLSIQVWFPYLPLYAIGYLLGTSLLRTFVIGIEKEEYRTKLEEAVKIRKLKQSITSLMNNMPALSFSKDAETGVYLACNQSFAEYAHKKSPDEVVGLTDAQIFDAKTAAHFAEDDRMALSMDEPYIFFEDVLDAAGNQRQFQTTKLKFVDDVGRLCTLGMCQDVTDMVRIKRESVTNREAYEKARSTGVMFSHIAQALASSYTDLYYVNLETEEFIEYRTDADRGELIEAQRGTKFFDTLKAVAQQCIHSYDRDALVKALERQTLLDTLKRDNAFIITYRLIRDNGPVYVNLKASRMKDDDRFIVLGVTDVDEQVKQQRAAERMQEEQLAYSRISALAGDFICVYVVDPETGRYREFSASDQFNSFDVPKEGADFFGSSRERGQSVVHPDDLNRYLSLLTMENVLSEIKRRGIFSLTYRLIVDKKPIHVQFKAAMRTEKGKARLIVGVNNIDFQVQQEEEYATRLAQAQSEATIDALTGVKNRHAFEESKGQMDRQLADGSLSPEFAIVVLDVNDLKKVNDTQGHKAGDLYIQNACNLICEIFKHSPVFRVGGDEFAVIVQGKDYANIGSLVGRLNDHNMEARRSGGIVVACGMAKYENEPNISALFERADQSMYENKRSLKNQ
ncbi:MAG: diguanylate cyclase [Oscillospiraceae bacterium]|nr:diguanylate cyclase [Oscillospiraceae bacterium]